MQRFALPFNGCAFWIICVPQKSSDVDTIFNDLSPEIPTLSRTTVYNTLELLKAQGLVLSLDFGEGYIRYDADTSPHVHFECEKCGQFFVFYGPGRYSRKIAPGFILKDTRLYAFVFM
jgi:Fur family peroxide stress response transcriptional regulator